MRLQALLQQGEGCAAFGNAAFLEAAVEAAVPLSFGRLSLVRAGGQTQLAKTPLFPPQKKGEGQRDKVAETAPRHFFSSQKHSFKIGPDPSYKRSYSFLRALFFVGLTKWVSLFFVHPLISVGVNKDQHRVLRPAKLVAFEGSQTQGVLVKVG